MVTAPSVRLRYRLSASVADGVLVAEPEWPQN